MNLNEIIKMKNEKLEIIRRISLVRQFVVIKAKFER